jgi:hypothetical protein
MVKNLEKLATEKVVDFSMIAKRQTTRLMCGLTVVAQLILMSSLSNQPIRLTDENYNMYSRAVCWILNYH